MNSELEREKFEKWWNQVLANSTEEWTTLERLAALDAWNSRAALSTEAQGQGQWRPSDEDVRAWNERHNSPFQDRLQEARCAFEDAESLHLTAHPPADTVTLGREEYEALKNDSERFRFTSDCERIVTSGTWAFLVIDAQGNPYGEFFSVPPTGMPTEYGTGIKRTIHDSRIKALRAAIDAARTGKDE